MNFLRTLITYNTYYAQALHHDMNNQGNCQLNSASQSERFRREIIICFIRRKNLINCVVSIHSM